MEWVRRMDSILNRAEEIILEELVLAQCRPRTSVYLCGACTLRYLDILTYSNHQNSWQKFVGSNHARRRCRRWRASVRLHPSPCPARFPLPSFFVMNSDDCYYKDFQTKSSFSFALLHAFLIASEATDINAPFTVRAP